MAFAFTDFSLLCGKVQSASIPILTIFGDVSTIAAMQLSPASPSAPCLLLAVNIAMPVKKQKQTGVRIAALRCFTGMK
jgi:hypothetical protein